jgi:hypothetical protein
LPPTKPTQLKDNELYMNDDSFVSPQLLQSEPTNASDIASDLSLSCVSDIFKLNANLSFPLSVIDHSDNNPFFFGGARSSVEGV